MPASPSGALPSLSGQDPYAVLGLSPQASREEIKAAYRALVKRHHPDAGGDDQRILALNAAWEVLRDEQSRRRWDASRRVAGAAPISPEESVRPAAESSRPRPGAARDAQLQAWLQKVYDPIDRLLGQVIQPFPERLRELAGDPYDDHLMATFCAFLQRSRGHLEQVEQLYRSRAAPTGAQGFSLSLYHCLSQVQDALTELERYTLGYVDDYLRDGREMLREARQRRDRLQQERRRLSA
ncbi:MAG: J domain-containing protein [Synechococcus sp.]|nr:J domain-containing protein [Synechococcus sp.]